MHRRIIILAWLLSALPATAQPTTAAESADDEAILRSQNLPTSGPQLLDILYKRIPSDDILSRAEKYASQLGNGVYSQRMNAHKELVALGPVVRPLLEMKLREQTPDAETAARLRQVIEMFPKDRDRAAVSAAARLIARDKPAGSLAALFDFVVFTHDETVRQNLQHAINANGLNDKTPAPLLTEMLQSKHAAQRAAAGEAIVRTLGLSAKNQIEPLLKDAHPLVRYQVGLALTEKLDKAGLPILIQSLADAPVDRVEAALDTLYTAAGDHAPLVSYQGPAKAPAFVAAWQKWYDTHQANLDLAKPFANPYLGVTIISSTMAKANTKNKIYEVGKDKLVRWEFEGPRYALDVQVLGANRLLMAEYIDRRVTERDFKGNILWQCAANMPIACQRLLNGNTFIATRQSLVIVDPDGKNVFSWLSPGASIMAACYKRTGEIAVVTNGRCILLDAQGRELKSFNLGGIIYSLGGQIELLKNGRVLVPFYANQSVVEFDWDGKRHWEAKVQSPVGATRLPNGNTLVTSTMTYRIIELDPAGTEVWSLQTEGRPYRARRR